MLKLVSNGNFNHTETWLKRLLNFKAKNLLDQYGQKGVDVLSASTPIDSGETAASWSYEIENTSSGYKITWSNSHVNNGVNIAIILQYGHGTGTGGYVEGRDYINPAIASVFDTMVTEISREVENL